RPLACPARASLPTRRSSDLVRALSEPLSKVDKITVVSTGDGHGGAGVNRVTGDMTTVLAQVPALVETLTGVNVQDLMRHVPRLQDRKSTRLNSSHVKISYAG